MTKVASDEAALRESLAALQADVKIQGAGSKSYAQTHKFEIRKNGKKERNIRN